MTDAPKFQYFRCQGEALELLKTYRDDLVNMTDEVEALGKEYDDKAKVIQARHQANLRSIWRRMAALVGLDPDKTWMNPDYQIETRFIDHGFGALTFEPRQLNPFEKMMGDNGEAEVTKAPALVTAPDKNKLN